MMSYELHVTVSEDTNIFEFLSWCRDNKLKPILIQLDKGENRIQPIFTDIAMLGSDRYAKVWSDQVLTTWKRWEVVRVKLESDTLYGNCEYYEQHTGYVYNPGIRSGFALSTNLLNDKWFLTTRSLKLENLIANHDGHKNERERIIFDTNKDLDKGWL